MTPLPFQRAGSGPPVLLIQGTGLAGRAWAPQIEDLQAQFEVAWFDNRGLDPATGPCGSTEDMGRDALQVLDALGWESAHLVGHSLGGVIAQQAALLAPERVRSLSLMCTFANGRSALSLSPASLWRQTRTALGTAAMRRRAFFQLVSDLDPTEANLRQLEDVFGRALHEQPAVVFAQVGALVRSTPGARLHELSLPALVVSATDDHVAPLSEGVALARALRTELTEVPGGHAVPVQDAPRINALLRDFLGDPMRRRPPPPPDLA